MNERIRELAEQARDWAEVSYKKQSDQFTSHWDNPIGYTVSQFFEQKFAELIVRECATKIVFEKDRSLGASDYMRGRRAMADSAVFIIKKHFGVDE